VKKESGAKIAVRFNPAVHQMYYMYTEGMKHDDIDLLLRLLWQRHAINWTGGSRGVWEKGIGLFTTPSKNVRNSIVL